MSSHLTQLSSFNHYPTEPCYLKRPERYRELSAVKKSCIARGKGCSYGDAALNANNEVILTERLNRFLMFDEAHGILTAEAGISLSEILQLIIPKGWFLPVTPGTQNVSLGGCVATDVHGKNHHRVGTFGNYVLWFELIQADGISIRCSLEENSEIFRATLGGMGLTGIIGVVSFQLIPITSSYLQVKHYPTKNLSETIQLFRDSNFDDEYSVAWIDTLTSEKNFGRSIIMTAHPLPAYELPENLRVQPLVFAPNKPFSIPFNCPHLLLNKKINSFFNHWYFSKQAKKKSPFILSYENYFYPLDKIQHWNRLYGSRGFIQYQCVLPLSQSETGIKMLLEHLQKTTYPVFLAVLKRFGEKPSQGILSFPMPGFTLALDMPIQDNGLFAVLDQLDRIVLQQGGRIYLAKDARLQAETFRAMYPAYNEWLSIKNKIDANRVFNSSLARRLDL